MAAFNFPNSPNTNDTHTENSVVWKWDGEKWIRVEGVGAQGATGAQGVQGAQGRQGAQGNTGGGGAGGAQGHQGHQGATGSGGGVGAQGAQGHQGHQGVQGAQGHQGHQGVQGAQGHQGHQGVQGTAGSNGNPGAQGHQGVQGAAAAGSNGIVKQVVSTTTRSKTTINNVHSNWTSTGVSVTINGVGSGNRCLVIVHCTVSVSSGYPALRLYRGSSAISGAHSSFGNTIASTALVENFEANYVNTISFNFYDDPGAGNHTYTVYMKASSGWAYGGVNGYHQGGNNDDAGTSTITVMEID